MTGTMQDHQTQPTSLKDKALHAGGAAVDLIKETVREWSDDRAAELGAALAFYTALSLAPLLVLVVVLAGAVLGSSGIQSQIVNQAGSAIGQNAASLFQTILQNAGNRGSSLIATVISLTMLMFGASGVFGQLKKTLNQVWELEASPKRGIWGVVKNRLAAFAMVLGAGALLVASLSLDSALAALDSTLGTAIPALPALTNLAQILRTAQVAKFFVSFAVFAALFAFIYKTVPDAEVAWKDVWIGGAATSLLFTVGNLLIGLYLGRGTVGSAYGAAGSLVAFLVWVYYSAQVFFFGAEFTQVYADRYGSKVRPDDDAVRIPGEG
jgi:membrane protein